MMEKKLLTEDDVYKQLKCLFNMLKSSGEFFDVDTLIFHATRHIWDDLFTYDAESQVNFNCGIMRFCQDQDVISFFGTAGCVIIFSELSLWANNKFCPEA